MRNSPQEGESSEEETHAWDDPVEFALLVPEAMATCSELAEVLRGLRDDVVEKLEY